MQLLFFKASNPAEEHAIVRRFLCPDCKTEVDFKYQFFLPGAGTRVPEDLLVCICAKCQQEYWFVFYLPPDYPSRFVRPVLEALKTKATGDPQ